MLYESELWGIRTLQKCQFSKILFVGWGFGVVWFGFLDFRNGHFRVVTELSYGMHKSQDCRKRRKINLLFAIFSARTVHIMHIHIQPITMLIIRDFPGSSDLLSILSEFLGEVVCYQ